MEKTFPPSGSQASTQVTVGGWRLSPDECPPGQAVTALAQKYPTLVNGTGFLAGEGEARRAGSVDQTPSPPPSPQRRPQSQNSVCIINFIPDAGQILLIPPSVSQVALDRSRKLSPIYLQGRERGGDQEVSRFPAFLPSLPNRQPLLFPFIHSIKQKKSLTERNTEALGRVGGGCHCFC